MMIFARFEYYPSSSSLSNTSGSQSIAKEPVIKSKAGWLPMSRVDFTTGIQTKLTDRSNRMVTSSKTGFVKSTFEHVSRHPDMPNSRASRTGPRNTV